jgi:hypothetical protein
MEFDNKLRPKKSKGFTEKDLGKKMSQVKKIRKLESKMSEVPQYIMNSEGVKTPLNDAAKKELEKKGK